MSSERRIKLENKHEELMESRRREELQAERELRAERERRIKLENKNEEQMESRRREELQAERALQAEKERRIKLEKKHEDVMESKRREEFQAERALQAERERRIQLEKERKEQMEMKRLEDMRMHEQERKAKENQRKQKELEEKLREMNIQHQKDKACENLRKQEDFRKQRELEEQLRELKLQQQKAEEALKEQKRKEAEEKKRKYLEPLKKPWREISNTWEDPWKQEFKDELLLKINAIKPAGGINYFNILLLGQAAAGKSSFVNTCLTAVMDGNRIIPKNQVYQSSSTSVSRCVEAVPMKTKDGNILPLRLFDCRGLDMEHGVPTEDIRVIIEGHVKNGYQINPLAPITRDNINYREHPEKKDQMHCIVYVANATNPSDHLTDPKTKEQIQYVKDKVAPQHLPQLVLFTNIDKIRISNTHSLRDIFRSQDVQDTCKNAADYMEMPIMNVLPMSNYHEEVLPTLEKDILALFYLLTMMQRANDYIIRITKDDVPDDFND
ncbi:reticulocyte-binding protein homolog 2a-like isoform X2 [Ostrea edulis]|uniref:reticulocyte-binding protein homolog 2a-like isoform X2 n=1 Tax=Ostrea edulis TaxID=37623 RepID=UPI0024AF7A83|nr:reticulocyte-binding protein homolog 2a-like isoform X2 [Ostrea edulis]